MSRKVILPSEVAKAIEKCVSSRIGGRQDVLIEHLRYATINGGYWEGANKPLNNIDFDTLATILYVGYEIEQSPEERIKRIYDRAVIEHGELGCQLDDYTTKILTREILNILKIKIEGVNT